MKKIFFLLAVMAISAGVFAAKPDPNVARFDSLMQVNAQLSEQLMQLTAAIQAMQEQESKARQQMMAQMETMQKQLTAAAQQLADASVQLDSAALRMAPKAKSKGVYRLLTLHNGDSFTIPEGKTWTIDKTWTDNEYDYNAKTRTSVWTVHPKMEYNATVLGKTFETGNPVKYAELGYPVKVEILRQYVAPDYGDHIVEHVSSDTYFVLVLETDL